MKAKIVRNLVAYWSRQPWWRRDLQPTLADVDPRHDRQHKRDQDRDGAWRTFSRTSCQKFCRQLGRKFLGWLWGCSWLSGAISFHFQEVVAGVDQVDPLSDHGALRREPHGQSLEVEQVEFTFGQGRAILRAHQQVMVDQGFGRLAAVDALKAHDEQLPARQLTAAEQLHLPRRFALVAQPATARPGEPCREIGAGQHAQFTLQALGPDDAAHHQPLVFL